MATTPTIKSSVALPGSNGRPQALTHELEARARTCRQHIVRMTAEAGSGHPGGSLSAIDILTALYFRPVLRFDPRNSQWPDRDRLVYSKGHACPALYAVLAEAGYFPVEELKTFRKLGSRLQGHAHIKTPGVEMSSGSLGQGLSFAIGVALAVRLDRRDCRVFALLGDGECDEGQVWEAAMAAAHHKVDNLVAIIDRNRIQNDRFTHEVMELEPFGDKWRSFGWKVEEMDGHDMQAVVDTLEQVAQDRGPTVMIARTVKGKGVSFMENNPAFHGKAPTARELQTALEELSR